MVARLPPSGGDEGPSTNGNDDAILPPTASLLPRPKDLDQGSSSISEGKTSKSDYDEDSAKEKRGPNGLRPNPEKTANFVSRITLFFMTPFFYLGWKKDLEEGDMFEPLPQHESDTATKRMEGAWEREKQRAYKNQKPPSLLVAILREYWSDIVWFGFLLLLEESIRLTQPLFMGRLIRYFRFDTPLTESEAFVAAAGVALSAVVFATIHHPYFYGLQKVGMQLKIAASGMVVKKGVRLSSAALHKTTVGHMVNILSTDVVKFDMGFIFIHYIWVAPIMLCAYCYFLYQVIGVSAFAGFGALVLLIPIQGMFSKRMGACRREIAKRSDKRISVMNEILNGIRVIKMYAWEGAFSMVIADLRAFEMKKVRESAVYQSLVMGLFWASGKLIVLFAVLCYVLTGNDLSAEKIFVATALYNDIRLPISLFLPFGIQFFFEMKASITRIQAFLELEEYSRFNLAAGNGVDKKKKKALVKNGNGKSEEETALNGNDEEDTGDSDTANLAVFASPDQFGDPRIDMENYTATWQTSEDPEEPTYAVRNMTFKATPGDLVAVVGPVGAGKSSLLSSILGETRHISGKVTVCGRVAYCSQDAWIFSGTVRENVIFGAEYDRDRYRKALEMSALRSDVDQFPRGDATIVGDRGTSLSGGQKARVALARAIYSDADIYLLDDPLSAVDASVGRFLFDKCIRKHLKDKVVVLVTHQVQFLDKADTLLLVNNGQIVASGPPSELKKSHSDQFAMLIQETERSYARRPSESAATSPVHEGEMSPRKRVTSFDGEEEEHKIDGKAEHVANVEEEDRVAGAVSWRIYGEYMKSMCVYIWQIPPLLIVTVGVQLLYNVVDWWLNKWTIAAEMDTRARLNTSLPPFTSNQISVFGVVYDVTLEDYMYIFIYLTMVLVVTCVIRCVWFRMAQTLASIFLHRRMFEAIVNTNVSFYDKNPIGRILNRFSKDVGTMDDQLSFVFFEFIMGVLSFIGTLGVILMINPIVLLPTAPLLAVFICLRFVYLSSSRDVKRLEATSRSPLYSHISAVMQGLITVRAYARQKEVIHTYHHAMNINAAAFGLTISTSRWFAICIDWLVAIFVSIVAFCCILTPSSMMTGEVALMLVYAVQLTGFFSWIMRQSAELQNGMVSVERIVAYAELESEHLSSAKTEISASWPPEGHLKLDHVYLKYDGDEYVLKDINLDIKPKEKIGIVGRTGAGKSSLLRAIFRLTPPCSGSIYIDSVNTAGIPLQKLRKNIAIIPQEPVLFIGSLRRNLDPFNNYADDELWDVLEQVELKAVVKEMSGGLETSMQEGGANLSVGQRQLVCLARALLRHAKILVIDEATANVDQNTDALIQKTIRARFADSTVLTIAHRLNTIMDSTRVLVLKDGEIVEFAHAHELLANDSGIFASLVQETGNTNASILRKMAEESFDQQHKY